MKCVYCHGSNSSKITKEHIISKIVLKTVFGAGNKNVSRSGIFGNKVLIDHEHIIKDFANTATT